MNLTTLKAIELLRGWIGREQLLIMFENCKGEEGQWFEDKLVELAQLVTTMPSTRGQEGKGDDAIVYLHYFRGSADFYITEKDAGNINDEPEEFQSQMFGHADLFGDGGEIGYISLPEILAGGCELDLHWTPKPLREAKKH